MKQKCFPRNSCSKDLERSQMNVSGGVHLQERCKNQAFNFTKERPRFVVILKIYRTAISWVPTACFHYFVMSLSF